MGVFDDKKFEQLDWMSQMTETIESELNGLLARLPERLELTADSVISFMDSNYNGLSLSPGNVVRHILRTIPDRPKISWDDESTLKQCFTLEVDENFTLDLKAGTMSGKIFLVKNVGTLGDDYLQKQMGQDGIQAVARIRTDNDSTSLGRANDILELLGNCEEGLKGRSWRKKIHIMRNRLHQIFQTNEWRIRDTTLANKVGTWAAEYIETGNLAAYSNFCKLKVMTHQNMPIYSIEEQE